MTLRVSDHALLRLLQRAHGVDMDALRRDVETSLERAATAAELIGGGSYMIRADGLRYVVRDAIVVTVLFDRPDRPDRCDRRGPRGR